MRKPLLICVEIVAQIAVTVACMRGDASQLNVSNVEKENAVSEALIRQRVEEWAKAVGAKDIDAVLSLYGPASVSFDMDPPLRYAGAENKRKAWREFFGMHTGPVSYDVHELDVTANGELAFAHSLNHVSGKLADGHEQDMWLRWTACFRRIDGVWLVVHDHISVPADLARGTAAIDLKP